MCVCVCVSVRVCGVCVCVQAYLSISLEIARIPRYTRVIIDHLYKVRVCVCTCVRSVWYVRKHTVSVLVWIIPHLIDDISCVCVCVCVSQVKAVHWDPAIRQLASRSLNSLTSLAPMHMQLQVRGGHRHLHTHARTHTQRHTFTHTHTHTPTHRCCRIYCMLTLNNSPWNTHACTSTHAHTGAHAHTTHTYTHAHTQVLPSLLPLAESSDISYRHGAVSCVCVCMCVCV